MGGFSAIVDRQIDVFTVTETWLADETDEFIIRDLCPTGYEFYNVPIVSRIDGGIGIMHIKVRCSSREASLHCYQFQIL